MTLNKIKRLKNLMDDTILTYAVLINDDYILIKQKKNKKSPKEKSKGLLICLLFIG